MFGIVNHGSFKPFDGDDCVQNVNPGPDAIYFDNRGRRPLPISAELFDGATEACSLGEQHSERIQAAFYNAALKAQKNDRKGVLDYLKGLHKSSNPVDFYFHFVLECVVKANHMVLKSSEICKLLMTNISHHYKLLKLIGIEPTEAVDFHRAAFGFLHVDTESGTFLSIPYHYGTGITQILYEYYIHLFIPAVKNPRVDKLRCHWRQQGHKAACRYCDKAKQKKWGFLATPVRAFKGSKDRSNPQFPNTSSDGGASSSSGNSLFIG